MRRAAKIDSNQPAIVQILRQLGCTVQHLHTIGKGCPDILIGINGLNILAEIKDGNKPPSQRNLTPDEKEWHLNWRGQVSIIESVDDAINLVSSIKKKEIS